MKSLKIYNYLLYAEHIEQYVKKSFHKNKLFDLCQHKIPLIQFDSDKKRLAKILTRAISKETYTISPPKLRWIYNKDKIRAIYDYYLVDKIVLKVFAQFLNELYQPFISQNVYSFQKGVSSRKPVNHFSQFIKEQRKKNQVHGVYILKVDIKSYSDSIYLGKHSTLWPRLNAFLETILKPYALNLIQQMVRPTYINDQGQLQTNILGIPTGSPISNFIYNFYCAPIDDLFSRQPDLFYARYGDDILLAHPDGNHLRHLRVLLDNEIANLSLIINSKKNIECYFSPAGNQGACLGYQGRNALDYLGYRIDGYGRITLCEKRKRSLLRALNKRIADMYHLLKNKQVDRTTLIRLLCNTVNVALDEKDLIQGELQLLIYSSTDQGQLKHLDYLIALNIASRVTGIKGARAFAKLPYKTLRAEFNLKSLVNLRNKK
ncbi:MAG: reverse transcriptase domain-containing protein [bacterium]|nr:reverse transcriptase domain-containing protein [bacterium]